MNKTKLSSKTRTTPQGIYGELSANLASLTFSDPVTHIYNPLQYAELSHRQYLERHSKRPIKALFLGMNPGPFGMAQTGVPFGAVSMVRDWMGIKTDVGTPDVEHPKRKILGFSTEKEEVSGTRFWGFFRERFPNADDFFAHYFVANYCPLIFLESSGKNRTPEKLKKSERDQLYKHCDYALQKMIAFFEPGLLIGIGKFAEDRLTQLQQASGWNIPIGRILHPSPASPIANRGWAPQAEAQLRELGVL